MTNPTQERLRKAFAAADVQLQAELAKVRASYNHPGTKGDVLEATFRDFLNGHLPRRYAVGHGQVVDRHGRISKQLDVVVSNEEHPINYGSQPGLFLIEGVSAAGEIKAQMGTNELRDCIDKGNSFRALEARNFRGDMANALPADFERFYRSPPFFVFCWECSVSPATVIEMLEAADHRLGVSGNSVIDAIFVLDTRQQYVNYGLGEGSVRYRYEDGSDAAGWVAVASESILLDVFLWLNLSMPRTARAAPIVSAYVQHEDQ